MTNEKKRSRTKKNLEEAFMRVYARKSYEDITITDICSEAGLYRSSFYNYYHHIGELLGSIEDGIVWKLQEASKPFGLFRTEILVKSPKCLIMAYTAIMRTMHENREPLKILMSDKAHPSFREKYKKAIWDTIAYHFKVNHIELTTENMIVLEYMVTGIMNAQNMWLQTDSISIEEMAVLLDRINKNALKVIVH